MAKENRVLVKLRSTESAHIYMTTKNKTNTAERLEMRKFDPILRRHVVYREAK